MLSDYDKSWCSKLLEEINRWHIALPFRKPVDPDTARNYHEIVTNPMDLQTMKRKLNAGDYPTVEAFVDDIQLICDNAKKFNGERSMYALMCDDILAEVKKQYSEKADSADEKWFKSLLKATRALDEHMNEAPADVVGAALVDLPDLEGLSEDVVTAIESELGGDKIENLPRKWLILNEITKKKIVELIENKKE